MKKKPKILLSSTFVLFEEKLINKILFSFIMRIKGKPIDLEGQRKYSYNIFYYNQNDFLFIKKYNVKYVNLN